MATITQIADRAGVSTHTVSRVLNGKAKESWPSMVRRADRIRAIAQEMGYRPNASARAIRSGKFNAIGLVLSAASHERSNLPENMLRGVADALEARGQHLIVSTLTDRQLTDDQFIPRALRECTADGLLINYNKRTPRGMPELLEQYGLPAIWINAKREHDSVYPDDFAGGVLATRQLLDAGHTRVAWLNNNTPDHDNAHYSEHDRREGYRHAMREAGLAERLLGEEISRRGGEVSTQQLIRDVLVQPDRPTAFVVYGRIVVFDLLLAAASLGLHCPHDLSVVTFDGRPIIAGKQIDTALVPEAEVGRQAVTMIQQKVKHPERRLPGVGCAFTYGPGGSVKPLR